MQEFFINHKVIICAGSGGVGKTTVAAPLGLLASQMGRRTLVLTIDPAKRLATSLGLDLKNPKDVSVPDTGGKMFAAVVDPENGFKEFILRSAPDEKLANKILSNLFVRQLSTQLSGSQEFTSIDRLLSAVESGKYDNIILDTPPSQHAMDFLMAPQKLYTLFQKNITKWFLDESKNANFVVKLISKGTQTVLSGLERVTGGHFMKELANFFEVIKTIQDKIIDRSKEAQDLLTSAQTGFVLVSGIDSAKIQEAKEFHADLMKMGLKLKVIIVNRALPTWFKDPAAEVKDEIAALHNSDADKKKIFGIYSEQKKYFEHRVSEHQKLAETMAGKAKVLFLKQQNRDVFGLFDLQKIADEIQASYNC